MLCVISLLKRRITKVSTQAQEEYIKMIMSGARAADGTYSVCTDVSAACGAALVLLKGDF